MDSSKSSLRSRNHSKLWEAKRPGIVFHCSGAVVPSLCDQKQTGKAFGWDPKCEPAQTACFPSALSLWIPSATVTFRAFLLQAGPGHQCGLRTSPAVPAPPSSALLPSNPKARHPQNSFPGQPSSFIHLPARQHPSFIPAYPFLHPQNSQNTSIKPKPCKESVFLSLQKSTFGGQLHSRNAASVSPPVSRLRNSRVEFVFSVKSIFLGVFWFPRGFFSNLIQAKKGRESLEKRCNKFKRTL